MNPRRFRIAFSFAGEKRAFVAKVADLLAQEFGKKNILYDKYHEAEFARYDLGIYLPKFYREESDLVVAVFSPDYDKKRWTGWEWMAIHAQLTKQEGSRVMLSRFNFANPDGLFENAAFVELDGKTAEQFAALIRERLEHIDRTTPPAITSPASPPPIPLHTSIPHNLPRLQSFFGREPELAQIGDALAPDNRSWGTLIDGEGGMGKTTLAVRAAYAVPPAHFQRIIFVSVKKHELDDHKLRRLDALAQANWLEMLNEIARELGDFEIPKSAESERLGRVRAALAGKHVLLLLDNLEVLTPAEQDQLFTFLQRLPPDCKALLTSRTFIGNQQAAILLQQLDPAAALLLLADIASHNPQFAKSTPAERLDLYHATGGRPLLLRWTAGQVGTRDCRTIADALARLRSCPPDNDPLEFVFGDLAVEFTEPEKQVLVALTYFTQPATVAHITTVANPRSRRREEADRPPTGDLRLLTSAATDAPLAEPTVTQALRTLANRSLVVPDTAEHSYTLVPLVADFLRRKFADLLAATGQSLEARAYDLIVENGYPHHDRLPLLDAAWPTVAPAIPLFVAGPNPRLQTVCNALQKFLEFTGRWDEWLALSLQAEAKALAAGNPDNAGQRAFHAGWVHYLRQQGDEVLACAGRAAAHWTTAKAGAREQSIAIRLRGMGHQVKQDYPAALADTRAGVGLLRSLAAESMDVAIGLNTVANIEHLMRNFPAAERDYREALRIARAVGYAEGVAYITGNLAGLVLHREDWPGAEALAREALPLSEKVGRKELIARDNHRLALALVRQGRKAEALPHAQQAVALFTQLGPPHLALAQATLQECQP